MKVNREPRPIGDAEAFYVYPSTGTGTAYVGIACGPLFNLMTLAEAHDLANALYDAAAKAAKEREDAA